MKVIAILPIKEHSERVPNKNFRCMAGVPLWMYPIGALVASDVIDEIVINTDCPERFDGVECSVPLSVDQRPADICGDDVSMDLIIKDVVERHPADLYIQVHASNPFVSPENVLRVVLAMQEHFDSVYPVEEHYSRFYREGDLPVNHNPHKLIPTQDLDPLYEETSTIYGFRADAFLFHHRRICGLRTTILVSPLEAVDIDTEDDFELANLIAEGKKALLHKS